MTETSPNRCDFCTERFDVFHVHCERSPQVGVGRDVYLAFYHSEDIPKPVCVVTLWNNWVEWIEVVEDSRRCGIATEVLRGLERRVGVLNMEGATEAGSALCDSLEANPVGAEIP